jgi:rfaE bifunctional protein kinase chain/domain
MRAGGAANAARNIASLGGKPVPVGVVGADEAGRFLKRILRRDGGSVGGILDRDRIATPTKTRILARGTHSVRQQVLRVDRVEPLRWTREVGEKVGKALKRALRGAGALLVSDYDLGTVRPELAREIFQTARKRGIPCLIDSRHRLREFRGAALAAPNEPEVEELAGRSLARDPKALARAGRRLMEEIGLDALVVTQGSDGMTVFEGEREPAQVPVFGSDQVADVTGAGDTVAAALALALAAGAGALEAARFATVAAGLVVMKQGTSTVTAEEIRSAL